MLEIERKFLVANDGFLPMATKAIAIWQGYLSANPLCTIRVRTMSIRPMNNSDVAHVDKAVVTIKSKTRGTVRDEWEYEIPMADAGGMKKLCERSLQKTRYVVPFEGYNWEVDIFEGHLKGVAVAEIELPMEDAPFSIPPFIGAEVTGNPMYFNSNLANCKRKIE